MQALDAACPIFGDSPSTRLGTYSAACPLLLMWQRGENKEAGINPFEKRSSPVGWLPRAAPLCLPGVAETSAVTGTCTKDATPEEVTGFIFKCNRIWTQDLCPLAKLTLFTGDVYGLTFELNAFKTQPQTRAN